MGGQLHLVNPPNEYLLLIITQLWVPQPGGQVRSLRDTPLLLRKGQSLELQWHIYAR
jgi:hypothetical protein